MFTWVFPLLAFLNVVWKMKGFSANDNALIQNEGCAMFLNEVMKKTQENQSLEIKKSRVSKKIWKKKKMEWLQIASKENLKSSQ